MNKEPKIDRLNKLCATLKISLDQVAMIGDDINDLDVVEVCGFGACPADGVPVVKNNVDLVLSAKGGYGCIREFVDE